MAMVNELSQEIIEAACEVHRNLGGPGLLETVYESALCHELSLRSIVCERQVPIPVLYKDVAVREPLFLDILVDNRLIIEVKATGKDYPLYHVQLFTHLRLMGIQYGMLINFGKENLKDGINVLMNKQNSVPIMCA